MPMKRLNLLLALLFPFLIFSQNSFLLDDSTTVFINEIHYDNLGADNLEGIEIAALSGTDLSCYKVYFVNGNDGGYYATISLDTILPESDCGMGFLFYPKSSIQNGSTTQGDGIALYNLCTNTLVQFISYEGVITATNGPFSGAVSEDIGIFQNGDPIGTSLQFQGNLDTGFVWQSDSSTYGQINTQQNFCLNNVELGQLQLDSSSCVLSSTESLTIQLINSSYSNSTDTLVVFLQTNDSILISDTLHQGLAIQDSLEFMFSQTVDLSQVGTYNFKAWIHTDSLLFSDTLFYAIDLYDDDSLIINLDNNIVYCHDQDTLVLDAQISGADFYAWNTGDTTQQLLVFPTSDTSFYFYAHNLCYADTVAVEVDYVVPEITFIAIKQNGDTVYENTQFWSSDQLIISSHFWGDVILTTLEDFESYNYSIIDYDYPNHIVCDSNSCYSYAEDSDSIHIDSSIILSSSHGLSSFSCAIISFWIYLEATDSNGCTVRDSTLVEDFVVGISENENHLMNVYPNPNGGNFSIKASGFGESSTIQAEVFNAFGQVVHREAFESHSTEIQQKFNLAHFEKGMYFISIKSGDKLSRKRFVIH